MAEKTNETAADVFVEPRGHATISLRMLFFLVTAIALFLGLYRISSVGALLATMIVAPALIRMTVVADRFSRVRRPFTFTDRVRWMLGSVGLVIATLFSGAAAFLVVAIGFGLLGLILGMAAGIDGLAIDTAVVGTAGGMIWGLGGALLAVTYLVWRYWNPVI